VQESTSTSSWLCANATSKVFAKQSRNTEAEAEQKQKTPFSVEAKKAKIGAPRGQGFESTQELSAGEHSDLLTAVCQCNQQSWQKLRTKQKHQSRSRAEAKNSVSAEAKKAKIRALRGQGVESTQELPSAGEHFHPLPVTCQCSQQSWQKLKTKQEHQSRSRAEAKNSVSAHCASSVSLWGKAAWHSKLSSLQAQTAWQGQK